MGATIHKLRASRAPVLERSAVETRDALAKGWEILESEGFRKPNLQQVIWRLMVEAVETLKRLPDRERSWLRCNERSIWPELARPSEECRAVEWEIEIEQIQLVRSRDNMAPPRLAISDPSAIDRMLVVLGWLGYVRSRYTRRDRTAFLELAGGKPPRFVRMRHFPPGSADGTLRMTKQRVLQHIASGLAPYAKQLTIDGR